MRQDTISLMLWFFNHKTVGILVQDVLLEIRAGKMIASGTRVTPDPRKGLIRLVKVGLLHIGYFRNGLNLKLSPTIPFELLWGGKANYQTAESVLDRT